MKLFPTPSLPTLSVPDTDPAEVEIHISASKINKGSTYDSLGNTACSKHGGYSDVTPLQDQKYRVTCNDGRVCTYDVKGPKGKKWSCNDDKPAAPPPPPPPVSQGEICAALCGGKGGCVAYNAAMIDYFGRVPSAPNGSPALTPPRGQGIQVVCGNGDVYEGYNRQLNPNVSGFKFQPEDRMVGPFLFRLIGSFASKPAPEPAKPTGPVLLPFPIAGSITYFPMPQLPAPAQDRCPPGERFNVRTRRCESVLQFVPGVFNPFVRR